MAKRVWETMRIERSFTLNLLPIFLREIQITVQLNLDYRLILFSAHLIER